MPKKHQRNFKIYESHGSPSQTTKQSSQAASSSRTVAERLSQLRREQTSRSSILQKTNEIATITTHRAVPPEVRTLLDVPEIAPPRPRPGARSPRTNRRLAGPAPPPSWLETSIHTPHHVRVRNLRQYKEEQAKAGYRHVPDDFSKLAKLQGSLPSKRSLVHQALKAMAQNWEFVSEYEMNNLATIPVALKSLLMSYLSMYSSDQGIDIDSLKILFLRDPELEGGTGADDLTFLDLTGLLSFGLSLVDLQRYFNKPIDLGDDLAKTLKRAHLQDAPETDLLESWEDEASTSDSVPKSLSVSRFPDLRRLSLAHAGAFASWKDLLALTNDLPRLTHLSLTYWPVPTMTPNSRASFIESKHGRVNFSGTHIYSPLKSDWHEATNILRRLSNNTYCLEWLDLEGCAEWVPALTFNADNLKNGSPVSWEKIFYRPKSPNIFEDDDQKDTIGVPWNGSWSQVTYVNLSQGCVPMNKEHEKFSPIFALLLKRLWSSDAFMTSINGEQVPVSDEQLHAMEEAWISYVGQHGHDRWCENELSARWVQRTVRALRLEAKGLYCHFDHGWTYREDIWPDLFA